MTIQLLIDGIAVKEIILPEEAFDYMKSWSLEERCEQKELTVKKHVELLRTTYHQTFVSLGHRVQYVICATSRTEDEPITDEEMEDFEKFICLKGVEPIKF